MKIRKEEQQDESCIREVTAAAFAGAQHASGSEAAIVDGLRAAGALTLSLVAEDKTGIVGHVAFSPVLAGGAEGRWYGLGPVSVRPDRQGEGIGSILIHAGLEQLRTGGAAGCVVLGDPGYYLRFGFVQGGGLTFDGAPPEYFMQQEFGGDVPSGPVEYHMAFFAC